MKLKAAELLSVEGRYNTFNKKFPTIKGAPLCNPDNFAKAGFVNISTKGDADLVKCFACDKQLGNWEAGDDPWIEHVRRGARCPFVELKSYEPVTLEAVLEFLLSLQKFQIQKEIEENEQTIEYEFENVLNSINE